MQEDRCVDALRGIEKAKKQGMNKFVEISAKTKENLVETFKEFYIEKKRKNKKKFMEKRNKNLKAFENIKKQENNNDSCC